MFSLPTLPVIMLLALKFHTVQADKCPEFCICDNIQLTVACVNKNLTEVPPTIDEAENHHSSCENKGLTKIPRGFSPDTRMLDLQGNHFHYIPANSFPDTAEVVSLHLQRCKIQEVEDGAFIGMKSLVYLYLSENDLASLSPEAFKGLPHLTYLHLEKNRFTQFPKGAFKLLPGLLALHMENNAITKLEAGLLSGAEKLRGLYLTSNAITAVAPRAFDPSPDLDTLHLGSNKLKEVPSEALSKASSLAELNLSHNPIHWIGAGVFQPVSATLKHLYLNHMGLEKVSKDSLARLGSGLRSLFLEGNQLEELPDLRPLTGLEVINLAENPLVCDCPLLPLRKWIEQVNLKVRATCGHPPELRGQRVKDVHVFKSCPGEKPTKPAKTESALISPPKVIKIFKAKGKPRKSARPNTVQKRTTKKRKSE
uniref:Chondroadherin-like b n=1 Tax=Cyprinus carpio TaxID=7962 RepID=A0A8C1X3D3_CYPCA